MFQEAVVEARRSAPPLGDDRVESAEEKLKVAEEKLRIAEEKLKTTEERLKVSEEKAQVIRHVNVSLEEDVTKSWQRLNHFFGLQEITLAAQRSLESLGAKVSPVPTGVTRPEVWVPLLEERVRLFAQAAEDRSQSFATAALTAGALAISHRCDDSGKEAVREGLRGSFTPEVKKAAPEERAVLRPLAAEFVKSVASSLAPRVHVPTPAGGERDAPASV